MHFVNTCLRLFVCAGAVVMLASCRDSLTPRDLATYLKERGWTYVDVPRELLGPGAIVTISEQTGITYRGSIASCIDDKQVTTPTIGGVALEGVLNKSIEFSADLFANYQGLEIGPEFSKVSTYKVTLKDATEHALDDIRLRNWLEANSDAMTSACRDYLGYSQNADVAGTVFILVDVIGVGKYEYSFHDKSGGKITLSAATLSNFIKPKADMQLAVTSDGNLTSNRPVYLAFKRGVPANPVGQGAAAMDSATREMNAYLLDQGLLSL